jgi:hypothetical protein
VRAAPRRRGVRTRRQVLELPAPAQHVARGQGHPIAHARLRLAHEAGEIATADVDLHVGAASYGLTAHARGRVHHLDARDLPQRHQRVAGPAHRERAHSGPCRRAAPDGRRTWRRKRRSPSYTSPTPRPPMTSMASSASRTDTPYRDAAARSMVTSSVGRPASCSPRTSVAPGTPRATSSGSAQAQPLERAEVVAVEGDRNVRARAADQLSHA